MVHSKSAKLPKKPHSDFPHGNGLWAQEIRENREYFGNAAKDPIVETAME
jgi:hypothetical protein